MDAEVVATDDGHQRHRFEDLDGEIKEFFVVFAEAVSAESEMFCG